MKNQIVLDRAFAKFEKQIRDKVRERLSQWCAELIEKAVYFRLGDYNAHNFTGNLLNSIMVGLYEDGKPVRAWYSSEDGRVRSAIMGKMTRREKPYSFAKGGDYEGRPSWYKATVPTNQGKGEDDARAFFNEYKPEEKKTFNVVVAYTVEYADWVEITRQTTGYMIMRQYAKSSGVKFMELKQA